MKGKFHSYRTVYQKDWLRAHVDFSGDECLIWPFIRHSNGRALIRIDGDLSSAGPVMCQLAHGDPPVDGMRASYSCGNRLGGCVNPRHLSWATRKEISGSATQQLRAPYEHARGSRHGRSKLTEDDVHKVRELSKTMTGAEIARMLGVTGTCISLILSGKSWAWLKD